MGGKAVTSGTETRQASAPLPQTRPRRLRMRELTILLSVIACTLIFGLLSPRFLGLGPAKTVLEGISTDGLMLIGMTVVIICGGFDLSIGSTMALGGLTA